MTIASELFFWTLNSIIIFAMATGTHAVLDRKTTSFAWNTILFVQPAYAEENATNIPFLKQKRPLFHDWTMGSTNSVSEDNQNTPLKFDVEKDYLITLESKLHLV